MICSCWVFHHRLYHHPSMAWGRMKLAAGVVALLVPVGACLVATRRPSALSVTRRVPRSNATVVIQGVLHGAQSSAEAVQEALEGLAPKVLVLELCASRWRSMTSDDASFDDQRLSVGEELGKVLGGARSAFARRGAGAGAFALGLGGVYAASQVAGFRPGIEFRVPLRWAETEEVDVVLGDKDVVETFASLWALEDSDPKSHAATTVRGLASLWDAVAGDGSPGTISLWRAVLGDGRLSGELGTLAGAVAALVALVEAAATLSLGALPAAATQEFAGVPPSLDAAVAGLSLVLSLDLLGRIGAKVIDARDGVLADATLQALDLDRARDGVVLVVVGALHVNGVARRLEGLAAEDGPG